MLPVETILLFLGSTVLICLTPAADNTLVFTQSAFQGRMAGIAVTLGFCTGLLVQVIVVVAGLAVLIKSSAAVFNVLKVFGVGYLAYLAWQVLKMTPAGVSANTRISLPTLYRRGALMNILNPMVPLFLLLYYPPFVDTQREATSGQLAQLGGLNILTAFCVFSALSFLGEKTGERYIRHRKVQMAIRCCTSLMLAVAATVLLWQ